MELTGKLKAAESNKNKLQNAEKQLQELLTKNRNLENELLELRSHSSIDPGDSVPTVSFLY